MSEGDGPDDGPRARYGTRNRYASVVLAGALLAVLVVACQTTRPEPSSGPPTATVSTAPPSSAATASQTSPANSSTPTAGSTAGAPSPGAGGDVWIGLVELAAEDPSPGGTYVVIENQGATPADVGCWRLGTMTREDLRIPAGSTVPAGGGLRLFFERGTVANPDLLELRDREGRIVDVTPVLGDTAGDDQLFGRVGDGWVLGRPPLPAPLDDGGFIRPTGC